MFLINIFQSSCYLALFGIEQILKLFLLKIFFIFIFKSFRCFNIKNNFKKIKKIYYFNIFSRQNNLKNNYYHTSKYPFNPSITLVTHSIIFLFKKIEEKKKKPSWEILIGKQGIFSINNKCYAGRGLFNYLERLVSFNKLQGPS